MQALEPLPIDAHLARIVEVVRGGNLVIVAEPGAGKTTRVPRTLLDAGLAAAGDVVVLEPRRLAARMAARRVAAELGEDIGSRVGYEVRFERRISRDTRIRFVTEGVLARRLADDAALAGTAVVVLDEMHERHLHGDVALALLRRLQRTARPDLRLIAMSATLDAVPAARFLGADVLEVSGRAHAVAVTHAERVDDRPLERQVAGAFATLVEGGVSGDVLVFLPGAREIRRAEDACRAIAERAGMDVLPLHGDLPAAAQDRAVSRGPRPKLILSTNVAESSITIEGVNAVIDSGLARVAGHSPWSGLPTLDTRKVSRASAAQRAGRAGRVRAGSCMRLYTRHDHDTRPLHDAPEIARVDLAETRLLCAALGVDLAPDEWLDAPPAAAWSAATDLLAMLGAIDATGGVTERGRRMAAMPLHPRLARLVLEADARGEGERGVTLAALLSERDVWLGGRARFGRGEADVHAGPSDALDRLERFEAAERTGFDRAALADLDLDGGAVRTVARARDALLRRMGRGVARSSRESRDSPEDAVLIAVLAAFGDRVGKRRATGSADIVLARGGSVTRSETSAVRDADLVVVLDASTEARGKAIARMLSRVEPEWLIELFPDRMHERHEVAFDAARERVEETHQVLFGGLVLDESRRGDVSGADAARVLAEAARAHGIGTLFGDLDAVTHLRERTVHAAQTSRGAPVIDDALIDRALVRACEGRRTFADLRGLSLLDFVRAELGGAAIARVEELTPESLRLPGGRVVDVRYEPGKPPSVASYLQDFFGMAVGPRVGGEPLVIELWAPNRRAVQVTRDLAGFWSQHYPALRRQLSRRYPRHAWPEDPLHATPPPPRRGRR